MYGKVKIKNKSNEMKIVDKMIRSQNRVRMQSLKTHQFAFHTHQIQPNLDVLTLFFLHLFTLFFYYSCAAWKWAPVLATGCVSVLKPG